MDNYRLQAELARKIFLGYDQEKLIGKFFAGIFNGLVSFSAVITFRITAGGFFDLVKEQLVHRNAGGTV